jgi:hypothetical protein
MLRNKQARLVVSLSKLSRNLRTGGTSRFAFCQPYQGRSAVSSFAASTTAFAVSSIVSS